MNERTTSHTKTIQSGAYIITVPPRISVEGTIVVNSAGSQIDSVTMWTHISAEASISNPMQGPGVSGRRVYGVVTFPIMANDGVTFSRTIR